MDPFLAVATYIIVWWLCFFVVLPIGARSAHEAGEAVDAGNEAGAPRRHNLAVKALWAAGIALVLWSAGAWSFLSGAISIRQH